jgi:cytochrome c oxidase subunit 2
MRATTLAAGGLACAGAAMTIAAFAGGGSAAQPSATPAPRRAERGLQVWVANGCGGCHTLAKANATGPIGPNLTMALRGESKDFIMRSIVLPGADLAPGYGDMMPPDYAKRIAPDDLRALVDFLAQ